MNFVKEEEEYKNLNDSSSALEQKNYIKCEFDFFIICVHVLVCLCKLVKLLLLQMY